ncbi:MAG: LysE family translocator [Desulfobacterales bacterium]|jgi:threonine/homoserine/homoserine lactone efflux protein
MAANLSYLISGVIFGLSGGLSPGPLLTLVVCQSLKHGVKEGIKVSLAPLFTDFPIVLATIYILSRLCDIQPVIGAISIFGAAFLIFLGYESLSFSGVDIETSEIRPQSMKKGIIANFLNPNPYLFWFSIGAPIALKAYQNGTPTVILFVLCLYAVLVGSKISIAIVIGKSRRFLNSRYYVYTIRSLGVILLLFAVLFVKDGLIAFGLL